jgi:hypothetical protein
MGFSVNGAVVREAFVTGNASAEILASGNGREEPSIIRLHSSRPASLILRFADGTGSVVAALPEYIGTVVIDGGTVASVTYHPSENTSRWDDYRNSHDRLFELRALVATAARFGAFRIEGARDDRSQRGEQLADSIRVLKAIDPTLGIYAAYAYAEADLLDQVRSVMSFMREDLRTDLFDVAMLANVLSGTKPDERSTAVPFCPLLSQGWGLLQVHKVELLPEIDRARDHLLPALWTTFDPEGMRIIVDSFHRGRLR